MDETVNEISFVAVSERVGEYDGSPRLIISLQCDRDEPGQWAYPIFSARVPIGRESAKLGQGLTRALRQAGLVARFYPLREIREDHGHPSVGLPGGVGDTKSVERRKATGGKKNG